MAKHSRSGNRRTQPGYRWWIRVAAVPLAISCIAAGSAIVTAQTSAPPPVGCVA